MDHVYTLLMLIVPCSVLCGHVPAPVNLTMESHHFIHLLRWQAGAGSPAGVHYRVIARSVNEGWKMVDTCGAVRSPLLCNLTEVFSKLNEIYYVNVTAILGNETSKPCTYPPFKPVNDTVLELPSLRVSPCNDFLCVYLQSPSERLYTVYKNLDYTLFVTSEKVQFSKNIKGLVHVKLEVVPGLQYCVSVNISHHVFASKPPVCSSKSTPVNSLDAVISVVLLLLALMIVVTVAPKAFKSFIRLKAHQPFVLSSFNSPYKVQLLPRLTVESVKCISLEANTYKEVQVNEEVDQEKEDKEVAYEGRRGCEEVVCSEEISEGPRSSLPVSPEIQYERTRTPGTETYTHVSRTLLAPDMITHHWKATPPPQTTSQVLPTPLLPIKTPIQELKKDDFLSLKRGDALRQEKDKEDSDCVNFFSLTLGGQKSEQQEETEKEEKMEDVKNEILLFALGPPKPAIDIQHMCVESTNKHISYSEEEEEEDTEQEEAFSGYMMRS